MKITIYGENTSARVAAACLADVGNELLLVFPQERGCGSAHTVPEPGLSELLQQQQETERLRCTHSIEEGTRFGQIHFLMLEAGALELAEQIARQVGEEMEGDSILVNRTTFPLGSSERLLKQVEAVLEQRQSDHCCHLIVEPDFMTEGRMIQNFRRPDRILLGSDSAEGVQVMEELYAPYNRNRNVVMIMSTRSAELTKFAANAMLATRVSFMNEMADVAEAAGADIEEVRQGIGSDRRIGFDYLYPGTGFGGPYFAKDVASLAESVRAAGSRGKLLDAVLEINQLQREVLFRKAWRHFGMDLKGLCFAVWGVAYKPGSNDIRNAPGIYLIEALLGQGAEIQLYDPEAMENTRRHFGDDAAIRYGSDSHAVLEEADALMVVTEWKPFWSPDFRLMVNRMRSPVIFDGRNLYSPQKMKQLGITYYAVGRGDSVTAI